MTPYIARMNQNVHSLILGIKCVHALHVLNFGLGSQMVHVSPATFHMTTSAMFSEG